MPTTSDAGVAAERERKRARDRIYQRRKRERDRNLIIKLKERVKTVEDRLDASKNSPASPNSKLATEGISTRPVDNNRGSTGSINSAEGLDLLDSPRSISPVAEGFADLEPNHDLLSQLCVPFDPDFVNGVGDVGNEAQTPSVAQLSDKIGRYLAGDDQHYLEIPELEHAHPTECPEKLDMGLAAPLLPARWTTLNDLFHTAAQPPKAVDAADFDAHIIIAGVLHGWDMVANIFKFTAVWECLRNVDELALFYSDVVARMAALKVIAMILRSQASKSDLANLPPYLRPRPSQSAIEHPKLIDYFIWPGFRERMVFQYGKYANDRFAKRFSKWYKFVWPDAPHAAYTKVSSTPIYRFTDEFLECSEDIQCYRLERDFFEMFPEFRGDVPVVSSMPVTLQTPDYSWASELELCEDNEEGSQYRTCELPPRALFV